MKVVYSGPERRAAIDPATRTAIVFAMVALALQTFPVLALWS